MERARARASEGDSAAYPEGDDTDPVKGRKSWRPELDFSQNRS